MSPKKDPIFLRLKKFPMPWGCSYACSLSNECSPAPIGKGNPKIWSFLRGRVRNK